MQATSYFRVERGGQSLGDHSQGFESRQHQKQRKFQALVEAIGEANLGQARQILQSFFNLEPMLRSDPLFLKLGRALEENNVHAAEHFVKEVRDKALATLPKGATHPKNDPHKPVGLGHHLIDFQA